MKRKTLMMSIIGIAVLVVGVVGVTFAFFNYTRTGAQNTVRTGTINFLSSETGNTVTLNNVFPVSASTIGTVSESSTDVRKVEITIDGNTTYNGGIEYVLTLDDVNIETNTTPKKEIPLSLNVTVEGLDSKNIGTPSDDYFTARGDNTTPSATALYSILAKETVKQDEQILVGYIPKNVDVKGKVVVKAYIDASKVLITDTPAGNNALTDGYTNGTDVTGKTVITTAEWNSLNSSPLSFKVKVEAREGIWVEEVRTVNVMGDFLGTPYQNSNIKIKKIIFDRMKSQQMNQGYENASEKADLTSNGEGKVLSWLEADTEDSTKYILYIVSDGDTYLTVGNGLIGGYLFLSTSQSLEEIEFNNVNTSRVTNMNYMFGNLQKLKSIDLSNFDTSNVTNMGTMFRDCSSLTSIDLSGLGGNNLTNVQDMFSGCTSLTTINMSNFNFGKISSLQGTSNSGSNYSPFYGLPNLETIDLSNSNTSNVTNMISMFAGCSSLETVNLSGLDTSNVSGMSLMFAGCSSLANLDLSSFDTSSLTSSGGVYNMFGGCSSLSTIYVSNSWTLDNLPSGMIIFDNNTALVGQAPNTTYSFDSSKALDKTYAVIATDTTPGYLTDISLKPTN